MKTKTAHVISHTHWDREWYMPYEKHHVRLVELMDRLLYVLEHDPEFRSFHLDGQTIILEDYLTVRPERKELVERFVREGRIHIGPWYVLQDEFLTSSEANVRNLLTGLRDAKPYGAVSMVGYFPDSFGNMGQAPQLLKQAGIDAAVFGRGVKPTGFNNMVGEQSYESPYSELLWESPDGSRVLGVLFANWYSNGNEIPANPDDARSYWESKIDAAERYASTPHLLFMNGCDHQPIQTNLSEALQTARSLFPDTDFVHSSFGDYLNELKLAVPEHLSVVRGELQSQRTDGWGTLVNTASSRVYLKQLNQACQTLLEKVAEPLAAYASLLGADYPHHLLLYAWKTLMQNHPHDSICGCSVDEVHREMATRFEKSRHVAETIADTSAAAIAERVDTSVFAGFGDEALPFVVFNTTGWERSGTVAVQLDVSRIYFREGVPFDEMKRRIKELPVDSWELTDSGGERVECSIRDLGLRFGYDLPDDRFRQPYFARTVQVEFEAVKVQANGHAAYALVRNHKAAAAIAQSALNAPSSLITGERTMENDRLRVTVEPNGSVTLTDKACGKTFSGLCVYENTGDIGNEYMYKQPNGEVPLTTERLNAAVTVHADSPYGAAFEIVHEWDIPREAEPLLSQERDELVWFTSRRSKRVTETVTLRIRTIVSLEKHGKGVRVRTMFANKAKDHRIRMLFPSDLQTGVHYADSIFEVAKRDNVPAPEWKNPSVCHHQQAFVSLHDETAGLTIANKGLNEYEVLQDERRTIAVTLLRSVGELGDWGVFPTPEAQCLGEHEAELMIIPHAGDGAHDGAYAEAYRFQIPWILKTAALKQGTVPPVHGWFGWNGRALAQSAVKLSEETGDLIIRWFNLSGAEERLSAAPAFDAAGVYFSDIVERRGKAVNVRPGQPLELAVCPHEIVTLAFDIT